MFQIEKTLSIHRCLVILGVLTVLLQDFDKLGFAYFDIHVLILSSFCCTC